MTRNIHLTLEERVDILQMLKAHCSFRHIARQLDKSPNCIAQEVKKRYTTEQKGGLGKRFNNCVYRHHCPIHFFCHDRYCKKKTCSYCPKVCCSSLCSSYEEEVCEKLKKPPYVCDGCKERPTCTLEKRCYRPFLAQQMYEKTRSVSRSGISYSIEELKEIDRLVSPGLKRGLSPHSIWVDYKNEIPCSERTLYRLIHAKHLSADLFDLPFQLRYRARKKNSPHKIDTHCRKNRTYKDFLMYLEEHPDRTYAEMDSVLGKKGDSKCLLSIYLKSCDVLLLYLRERNTAQSVIDIFNQLYRRLGKELFQDLFGILLTDNGSEFSNPLDIELDDNKVPRTKIFYCDPGCPNQKAAIEGSHKHLRRILPKGSSFETLSQEDVSLIVANINAFKRKKLGNRSPIDLLKFFYGDDILEKLDIPRISQNEICLTPSLLK